MDWAKAIRNEAEISSILHADELGRKYNLVLPAVTQALCRQEGRGIVEHVGKKIYFNRLAAGGSSRDLVNVLRKRAYISLDSALREYGISTQSPQTLTCITTDRPWDFKGLTIRISYRHISPHLYWGFTEKKTRYGAYRIAEPEKALLDWIYLKLQEGLDPALDELDFGHLRRRTLLQYVERFPSTVYKRLLPALASETFAA